MTVDLEVLERILEERRSDRQFLSEEIAPSVVERLLEAACSAPSASNRQPYRFMVITRRETIDRMVAVVETRLQQRENTEQLRLGTGLNGYERHFLLFGKAPVVIVVFFRANDLLRQMVSGRSTFDEVMQMREALSSAAAATMQLLLAAHAMDLGACWMTGPCLAEQELMLLLKAPPGLRIAALVPIGHRAARASAPQKRRAAQLRLAEPEPIGQSELLGTVEPDNPE